MRHINDSKKLLFLNVAMQSEQSIAKDYNIRNLREMTAINRCFMFAMGPEREEDLNKCGLKSSIYV